VETFKESRQTEFLKYRYKLPEAWFKRIEKRLELKLPKSLRTKT